jgi:hypothetical protein
MAIRVIKVEGGEHGYTHAGDCTQLVTNDIQGDFPGVQVWDEGYRGRPALAGECMGCGGSLDNERA